MPAATVPAAAAARRSICKQIQKTMKFMENILIGTFDQSEWAVKLP